jgi:UDP-N-acetyl-D-mannosaminuronate dehydrogenase
MKEKIGVVGLGKLGLPLALVFCKVGYQVSGVDVNPEQIEQIRLCSPQRHSNNFQYCSDTQSIER